MPSTTTNLMLSQILIHEVLRDVTVCSLAEVRRRFRVFGCLHHQGTTQLFGRSRPFLASANICRLSTINSSSFDSSFWINLPLRRRPMNILNTIFTSAQVITNPLPVSYHKICNVMYQLCNRTVNEKHLLIMVNCFSLNTSIFNKQKNCTFMCLMLCYFTFPFLVDQIFYPILCGW